MDQKAVGSRESQLIASAFGLVHVLSNKARGVAMFDEDRHDNRTCADTTTTCAPSAAAISRSALT